MATSLEMQEFDLIDLHVGSPILPTKALSQPIEPSPDSLLDAELLVLNERLQISSFNNDEVPLAAHSVDLEDILITIDDDRSDSDTDCNNTEALNVLMQLDQILDRTLESSNSEQTSDVENCLEELDNYLQTFDTTDSAISESSESSDASGHVNHSFQDTEDFKGFKRSNLGRSTIAEIGHNPTFKRTAISRHSVGDIRISWTGGELSDFNETNIQHRPHTPGDCCTGTVVVETANNESSYLRSSMRCIRHIIYPSGSEVDTIALNVDELVAPTCANTIPLEAVTVSRPFSAPVGRSSSYLSERRSRPLSREPGDRARSSSASSRSRRPRSVSSSDSSLTSSVDIRQTAAPTRVAQEAATQSTTRRSCERTLQHDMPEAESPLGHWPHSLSSMLACLGCTIGLFNISRFAILTIHFGANFIFQFFILSLLIGLPLYTLQLCLGQQLGSGVIDMWRISPIFQGVGVALLATHALIGLYSIMGISWMFVYFRDSFITKMDRYRWAEPFSYYRDDIKPPEENSTFNLSETVPDYFSGIVLQRHHLATGNANFGTIKFQLAFNLAVVWMIVFVSLSKGLRSYGKVIYVFTLLPVFGMFVVCSKILSLIPPDFVYVVFPETSWNEFFLNSKSWIAASQEVFLTWGLLGASVMQIASHNKHKHLLQRDSSLIAVITFVILLLAAFLANTCVQILRSHGYTYLPNSFEKINSYSFLRSSNDPLPPSLAAVPVRYMPHQSFIIGESVNRPGIDHSSESGYQALRFATELVPATFALMGSDEISPFWAVLFYFILILFGIAQQLAIWHCVITGIMAIKARVLKSWETTITFFSCAFGFLLGLPMATEFGINMVYFMDYTIGGIWWLVLIVMMQIIAVFMVRGRPYSGDALVYTLFTRRTRRWFLSWAPPLLSFTWNVVLPISLMVFCIAFFKNGNFRELFVWHHAPTLEYWPLWMRQIGAMLQLIPVLCVPLLAVIQSYRYLNNGPPDILERVQLLYRPPLGEHMQNQTLQETTTDINTTNVTNLTISSEDPPPKYTPPPSYTTATGARIAKYLRQSIRRSVRRIRNILGEGSSHQTDLPPPNYNDINGPQTTVNVINIPPNQSTFSRELSAQTQGNSDVLSIADVASILRHSFRRSRIRRGSSTTSVPNNNNPASLSAETLIDSAAPIGETSLVLENLSKDTNDLHLSVI